MFRTCTTLGVLLLTALAGCAKPATSPTPSPTPVEFLDYTRQGGLLGTDDHLAMLDNGAATLTQRGGSATFTVDAAQLAVIEQQLADAGFDRLDSEYGPEWGCCDQFTHRIRYRGRTVRALDTDAPARLRIVFQTLNQIIAAHSR